MRRLLIALVVAICLSTCISGPAAESRPDTGSCSTPTDDEARAVEQTTSTFFAAVSTILHGDPAAGTAMLGSVMATPAWSSGQPILAATLARSSWVFESYGTSPGGTPIGPSIDRVDMIAAPTLGVGRLARAMVRSSAAQAARPLYLREVGTTWKAALATPLCITAGPPGGGADTDIPGTEAPSVALHLLLEGAYLSAVADPDEGETLMRAAMAPDAADSDIAMCVDYAHREPYILFSYAQGTRPDDGYTGFDPFSFTVAAAPGQVGSLGTTHAFALSNGADAPRPFTCDVNRHGQCRIRTCSDFYVGIRRPSESLLAWPFQPGDHAPVSPHDPRRTASR